MKSLYSNSKIYNYSCRSLSEKLSIRGFKTNKDSVRRSINFLLSKGLCKIENGHLILLGKRKFHSIINDQKFFDSTCNKIIQVRIYNNHLDQIRNLQSRGIIKSINRQRYTIKSKLDLMKVKSERIEGEKVNTDIMLSLDSIADITYTSRSTANKVKRFSVNTGLITSRIIGGRELSNTISYEGWKSLQGVGLLSVKSFFYKGRIYEVPRCVLGIGKSICKDNTISYCKRFTKNSAKNETPKIERDGSPFIDWIITLED